MLLVGSSPMMETAPQPSTWSTLPPSFDGFTIVRALGGGGMGSVFLARDAQLDRLAAIKFIAPHARDARALARFTAEARALARIDHPNVARLLRTGTVDGEPYVACEYVPGQRLDRVARPLDWSSATTIARGLARGLAAAHASGVLHRDVKASNVMLTRRGDAKLIDFGLARVLEEDRAPACLAPGWRWTRALRWAEGSGVVQATRHGNIVGTPRYLAPELWRGGPATWRTDLYALGLVIFELVAGRLPHPGLVGTALALAVLHDDPPRLATLAPATPRAICDLVDRAIAREPARRPATVASLADELDAIAAS